jgi:hypothetical protein
LSLVLIGFVLVVVLGDGGVIGRNHDIASYHEQHGSGQLWCLTTSHHGGSPDNPFLMHECADHILADIMDC